ncbi:MAG: glucose-6-phosphate isomerase [SAR116 cluster bacterium]|nr:glucose-6-phosphate isomerase [SAR116 cluster bacterium]
MEFYTPKCNEKKIKDLELALSKEVLKIKSFNHLTGAKKTIREKFLLKNLGDLTFDASRHCISDKALEIAKKIFDEVKAKDFLEAIWNGNIVNKTENRRALHPALRAPKKSFFPTSISNEVHAQREKLFKVSESIRNGKLRSFSGEKYTSLLVLGIGGSDLGPRMAVKALSSFSGSINISFVSNIDPAELSNQILGLNPKNTLVIISSKSFTTLETISNANATYEWMSKCIGEDGAKFQRLGVTANINNAKNFGLKDNQIIGFSNWVGGRCSIWSGVGLPLAISIGQKHFEDFLDGGFSIDTHVKEDMNNSIPSLMAMLGYIHRNYIGSSSHCIVPYDSNLAYLPSYLQQLEMESNGKSVSINGDFIESHSAPVIWGLVGSDSQHSFFQMLHQGSDKIPIDIMVARKSVHEDESIKKRHRILVANALGQAEALFRGNKNKIKHKNFDGSRSVSLISYNKLTPFRLGSLIAIYEYKVMIQAALWKINPFDQFGVELGKEFANALTNNEKNTFGIGTDTLNKFLKLK